MTDDSTLLRRYAEDRSVGGGTAIFLHLMSLGKVQITVIAGLLVAGITTIALQHRTSVGLREEISALQRDNQQIPLLRTENKTIQTELESLPTEHAENARLRIEVNALKEKLAAQAAAPAPISAPEPMRTLSALNNVGSATPTAGLESLVWAKENFAVAARSGLLTLTPKSREKLGEIFARFSEEDRAKHGLTTPEQMLAFFFAGLAKPFSGLQIAEQHEIDTDNIAVRAALQRDGGETDRKDFVFHRSAHGWQWVMPGALIDELPHELNQPFPAKPGSK